MPQEVRQYNSRNRRRPCDRCRQRKLRCRVEGQPPCQGCARTNAICTFTAKPNQSTSAATSSLPQDAPPSPTPSNPHVVFPELGPQPVSASLATGPTSLPILPTTLAGEATESTITVSTEPWTATNLVEPILSTRYSLNHASQGLEDIGGHFYQLAGGSSDADPWLLDHCKFEEDGFLKFNKAHFRNVSGVSMHDTIPAHFMVGQADLHDNSCIQTRVGKHGNLRDELFRLVTPDYGVRLLRLFLEHVFPLLPVLSRTALGLENTRAIPKVQVLENIPTHLLAAIYASSMPFAWGDDQLTIWEVYDVPPGPRLWCICYELLLEELHRPRLDVLQAAILYMHRQPQDETSYCIVEPGITWSFMGMVVGLAQSLGLNRECRSFRIPLHEMRLRRRLWWAVYIEDKWLSLLLGRPPYLRRTECDVVELDDEDFATTSLMASQKLCKNLAASIDVAKPLFRRLSTWRESLPLLPNHHSVADTVPGAKSPYPATTYNAYLTLVVCVWRALLRPMNPSAEPPRNNTAQNSSQSNSDSFFDETHWESDVAGAEPPVDPETQENTTLMDEIYEASVNCANTFAGFVLNLAPASYLSILVSVADSHCSQGSRTSFVLVSNFMMLLLIQAPNLTKAIKAKELLLTWRRILDYRYKAFRPFAPAKFRLGAYYQKGLENTFILPPHVDQALQ
ncbi:hypothetical protein FDECE_13454 [Fusarium decemcellulare]|nr:hypothetical protein FDECE_13454 [Fusarium decemcellulare]